MLKVIRFVKIVTMILFVVALAIPYFEVANDSRMIVLYKDLEKRPILRIEPSWFFYISAGFFILLNMLISSVSNLIKKYPLSRLPLPHSAYWLQDADSRQNLREVLQSWIQFLAIILNAFLIVLMVKVWLVNRMQGGQPSEYMYFVWSLFGVLLAWGGFIFYRLRLKRVEFVG